MFTSLPNYKSLWPQEETDKQYWNEIMVVFLKWWQNTNISRKGFPINMYSGGLLYKPYFIAMTLQE